MLFIKHNLFYFVVAKAFLPGFLSVYYQNFSDMASYQQSTYYSRANTAPAHAPATDESLLWKLLLLTALTYFVWSDKISINFSPFASEVSEQVSARRTSASLFGLAAGSVTASLENSPELATGPLFNSTLAMDPAYALRHSLPATEVRSRLAKCQDYVERFGPVAIAEMNKYGIPASIILAQGLLESDAGESALAQKSNNHFGIKCFSKHCGKGHCMNFGDDSHKDFFIKYGNVWGSFRAHSQFLKTTKRYAPLFRLEKTDYRGWAAGLAEKGYATDKKYGDKLIAIIRNMKLDRFDQ
ncbi:MAG: glucosaminidase domain-containing protein [Saprospiraceae bacterium]